MIGDRELGEPLADRGLDLGRDRIAQLDLDRERRMRFGRVDLPARSRSTARVAAAWMRRCARTGGMITAASRDSARFTTAVSIPGHTFSMIPATTSSPAMSAVGTPRWVAASANISPSDSARPSSRTSLYAP